MKKTLMIMIICIVIIVGVFIAYKISWNKKEPEQLNLEKTIIGTITDATMNTITLKDMNNIIYTFSREDIETKGINGILIGESVTITYKGEIDSLKTIQNIEVIKIEIIAVNEEQNNEENKDNVTNNTINNSTDTEDINKYNDNGIFKEYYKQAYEKMQQMTLDEKIGQLFLVRVPANNAINIASKYQFGGYIIFGRDTKGKTKDDFTSDIQSWQDVSKIPLLIATDEEGGIVVRVSSNPNLASSKFKSSQELYSEGGFDLIKQDTITKNNLLKSLGINVNLAPVADVSTSSSDYIYSRAFGKDASQTAQYIQNVISSSHGTGVSNVLKHFPGYGNNVDTHTGISTDKRTLQHFRENDFLPFSAGIKEGAEAILVSHNIIVNVEDSIPASLSTKVHDLLRNELGFTGIIMTDDLAMDAIKDYVTKPSVQALKSGNDMIIITDYESGINDIKEALNNNELSQTLIDNAVTRILQWKYYKKLI